MPEEHDDRDFRAMSNTDNFVHLHVHTDYSMLDGAAKVGELLDKAVELKMPALAITDHGNNFGAFDFWEQATKKGIKPIIGIEYKPFLPSSLFTNTKQCVQRVNDDAAFWLTTFKQYIRL